MKWPKTGTKKPISLGKATSLHYRGFLKGHVRENTSTTVILDSLDKYEQVHEGSS